jgi:hypothetical protein
MYVNGKMMRAWKLMENDGKGEFQYDIFVM